MKRFIIELWGKPYCPVKELEFNFYQIPERLRNMLTLFFMQYIASECECRFCILLPDDNRQTRLNMQSDIAKHFGEFYTEWMQSLYCAWTLFNSLSAQEQDVLLTSPGKTYREIADMLKMKSAKAARSTLDRIRLKTHCNSQDELLWLLVRAGLFKEPPLQAKINFANAEVA